MIHLVKWLIGGESYFAGCVFVWGVWDIGDLAYSGADINVNVWSKYRFMNLYLGKSVKIIKDEKGTEKYKDILDQMEVYPGYGSIRIVGDEVLVKIAE